VLHHLFDSMGSQRPHNALPVSHCLRDCKVLLVVRTCVSNTWTFMYFIQHLSLSYNLLFYILMQITDVQTHSYPLEKFISEVDVPAVWCPESGDYGSWICQLLCCLIGSGSVNNELLQLLSPVCRIKVCYLFSLCLKLNHLYDRRN